IQARQLVNHGHIKLNGKRVDIPSVTLKIGDEIELMDSIKQVVKLRKLANSRAVPSWLSFDGETFTAKVVSSPTRKDIDFDVKESAIVELYSK
ncbi:MAG: S4 domain-containing protein, partial [Sphaerochaeta sp.]|nr:S4 domain-containing protein [Sphaerochaeta sp.]